MDNAPNHSHGVIAEFETPEKLLVAARAAFDSGYREMDAYTPIPVEGLTQALGHRSSGLQRIVFGFGVLGCATGYLMCLYLMKYDYPLNIGGRPLNSWPAYIPVTFELTILFAALAAVIGMLVLNKLPRPNHPVFNVAEFERASRDRFFLCLEATDPRFEIGSAREFLNGLHPLSVTEVEP
jgi:hypothetical protein